MKVKYNSSGNIHIPKIMAKGLGFEINDDVLIECIDDKIILSSMSKMRTKNEIKTFLKSIENNDDDISKGMKAMAEWILFEDIK